MKKELEMRLKECGIGPGYSIYLLEEMKKGRMLKIGPEGTFLMEGAALQKQKQNACGCPMDCPCGGVGFCKI